jgi:hypothetical protein
MSINHFIGGPRHFTLRDEISPSIHRAENQALLVFLSSLRRKK